MTRIEQLAAIQPTLNELNAQLAYAQAEYNTIFALPLDKFRSNNDGLSDFVNGDGTVAVNYNIMVDEWSGNFAAGANLLNAIGAQPFPQSRGPATMVTDDQGRLQFQTDGTETVPNPITLHVIQMVSDGGPDFTTVESDVILTWVA